MDAEAFRKHGHKVVDWMADYMENVERFPVLSQASAGDTLRSLPPSPPAESEPYDDIMTDDDFLIVRDFAFHHGLGIVQQLLVREVCQGVVLRFLDPSATEVLDSPGIKIV